MEVGRAVILFSDKSSSVVSSNFPSEDGSHSIWSVNFPLRFKTLVSFLAEDSITLATWIRLSFSGSPDPAFFLF